MQRHNRITSGYVRNNPVIPTYWNDVETNFKPQPGFKHRNYLPPDAYGFLIYGHSGTFKSTSVLQIARLLRCTIIHEDYDHSAFPFRQIPMLVVRCPHNCPLVAFISEFFHTVDDLVGTNYFSSDPT